MALEVSLLPPACPSTLIETNVDLGREARMIFMSTCEKHLKVVVTIFGRASFGRAYFCQQVRHIVLESIKAL